ncbi:S-methyl-5-thioribose-1-phosphate isomerase [candidate division WOR-3 bacterium]|nr:S-methyl-5-thioribose-1-phosphate isomerase [candidate division WOR-3 bacterium]
MPGSRSKLPFTTIVFDPHKNSITVLDQTRLPREETYVTLATVDEVFDAIRTMQVRGAPLIGIIAAYGIALASQKMGRKDIIAAADHLADARPTAVNLQWAVDRMKRAISTSSNLRGALIKEARSIDREDQAACRRIGKHGATLITGRATLMVHCNAGALATNGIGTALGIIYTAEQQGKAIRVIATETRPLLQGARLTAWELTRNNIETCVICDSMAATYMPSVEAVFVGADRIAANGDTANKIGTGGLAILAHHYHVPFYVAAPISSFDPRCVTGNAIPIEKRDEQEIRSFNGVEIVPLQACVANPSFDITPAELITAFITERGIIEPPFSKTIIKTINKHAVQGI